MQQHEIEARPVVTVASDTGREDSLNPTLARLLSACRMDRVWVRGEGAWLFDGDGRRFLDCYAQYGAVALGHNAPCVRDAVRAALNDLEPAMVQPYRAPYAEKLASLLTRLAPGVLSCCIFATSGAEVVEAAIKLVRARTRRPIILSANGSFHGKTLGALALAGQSRHAEGFGPLPIGFEHVEFGDADRLAARLARDGTRVAAVFLEPIQGERGVHLPPPGYLARVREICTRHGVALVLDEIQTGLGRTGRLFACEDEGIAPDVLLLGKALGGGLFPLSACLTSSEFWDDGFALKHSSTFANNNVACRVGLAVLEALTSGGLCAEAARKGERLLGRLRQMAERHPGIVATVRGRGLMSAIELRSLAERGALLSFLTHQGLYPYAVAATIAEIASVLVLPTLGAENVIRVAPPLVISDEQIDAAMDGIESVLDLLDRNPIKTILRALGALDPRPASVSRTGDRKPLSGVGPRLRPDLAAPDYAFVVHYTSVEDVVTMDPDLDGLTAEQLKGVCAFAEKLGPGVLLQAPTVRSATGQTVNGLILGLSLLPEDMIRLGRRYVAHQIERLVDLAWALGVGVVGLGGYTTPYSRRGLGVIGRGPAITTGNPLTAGMAWLATRRVVAERGLDMSEVCASVVGAAGSVGSLCARLLARDNPRRLTLLGNPARGLEQLLRLARRLEEETETAIEVATDLDRLAASNVIITATTSGRPLLEGASLSAGTIVCDVARPPDTAAALRARPDLCIIEGGRIALPDATTRFGMGNLQNLPDGVTLACLGETILLALEGAGSDSGVGDDVPLTAVDRMLELAARHGFGLEHRANGRERRSTSEPGVSAWAALS
jgi:acetylornithine/succinyldiaminopimelate/putrescine aminotransferase/predicted amino acid dehydrogenase